MVPKSAMKTLSFTRGKPILAAVVAGIGFLTYLPETRADYLYWGKGALTTGS